MDQTGTVVIPCTWMAAESFRDSQTVVQDSSGLYGVINAKGEVVVPCEWEALEALGDQRFRATRTCLIEVGA